MTDNETIKAFEQCFVLPEGTGCDGCPYKNIDDCYDRVAEDALKLFNNQNDKVKAYKHYYDEVLKDLKKANAKIVSLEDKNEELKQIAEHQQDVSMKRYFEIKRLKVKREALEATARVAGKAARADAVRMFADKLKKELFNTEYHIDRYYRRTIDRFVNEMEGDSNAD